MSFSSLLNEVIKVYRKGYAGADVEGWTLIGTYVGRFSPVSPTDIQASAMMIDFSPTHKLYTKVIDNSIRDSGTAEALTDGTKIVDTTKSWATDEHKNRWVRIIIGSGAGALGQITANDSTTLTVITSPAAAPDDTYEIVDGLVDLKQGDKVVRDRDSQEFQVLRVMPDSIEHHLESWVSEVS
jgi:hypothetical protein